jgi:hypothetical protein
MSTELTKKISAFGMTVCTEKNILHPQNPPYRETQISQYLAVQIQIEILFGHAAAEGLQPDAAARHPKFRPSDAIFPLFPGPEF